LANARLFSGDFQPGCREGVLRIRQLTRESEGALLLDLKSRNEKLRSDSGCRRLTYFTSHGAKLREQGILS
jgi:hypothetical protein